ncbi:hypothetical protein FUAX_55950 (plasmid) [Fulvitalea axinellae]|uniref:ParB/Sulfiredoxin domain-containing protein n=1 Tax=Fulvitalea axinellae TaxID=1182444 RepID=A0AAU9DB77_9BACT|nr:hypothetical protein FUAX_55950 [Fulvitalea axinellae]
MSKKTSFAKPRSEKSKSGVKTATRSIVNRANLRLETIKELPELRDFIRKHSEEEFDQLLANIYSEGVRDPIVYFELDGEPVLLDGHHRKRAVLQIRKELGDNPDYKLEKIELEGLEEAKDWMINNQLGRRNLTKSEISFLRGLQYNREKSKREDNLKQGDSPKYQNDTSGESGDTAKRLAKQHGVGVATIKRDSQFAEGLEKIGEKNPELKTEILSGKSNVKKGEVQAFAKAKEIPTEITPETVKAVAKPKPMEAQDHQADKEVIDNNGKTSEPVIPGQTNIDGEVEISEEFDRIKAVARKMRKKLERIENYPVVVLDDLYDLNNDLKEMKEIILPTPTQNTQP